MALRTQNTPQPQISLNNTDIDFPVNLPRDMYIRRIIFTFRGRLTTTVAGTGVDPEGILNLVKRLKITFNHEIYGQDTPLDMSGPSLFTYREFYRPGPGRLNTSIAITAQIATIDFEFQIDYDFVPEMIQAHDVPYFLHDAPRDSSLIATISWGSAKNVVQGSTSALTAFGSASGSPTCDITIEQVLDMLHSPLTSMYRRQSLLLDASAPAVVDPNVITPLVTGETIRSLMIKQFVKETTAGLPPWQAATLVDPISPGAAGVGDAGINVLGVKVGKNYIRKYANWQDLKEENRKDYGLVVVPSAYAMIDWAIPPTPGGNADIDRSLVTQDFITRRLALTLNGTLVTQANGQVEITTSSIKPNPQIKPGAAKKVS